MGSSYNRRLTLVKQTGYGTYTADLGSAITGITPTGFKGDYHDLSEFQNPGDEEYNGMLQPINRIVKISDMAEVPFDGDLTFQNADYLFSSGWNSKLTGVTIDTTGFQRRYRGDLAQGTNTPLFTTVLAGDDSTPAGAGRDTNGSGYAIFDAFVPQWEVGAARGGITKASGTYSGHSLAPLTTPQYNFITLSRLAGKSIPFWAWKLYIDDAGGTVGTTQKAGVLIDWSIKVNSAFHHKNFQDGQISPTSWGQGRFEVTLDLTFEQNSTALAEFIKFQSGATRLIQLKATGTQIGAGPAVNTIFFNLEGIYTAFDKPGDSDGNTTIGASFKCYYTIPSGYYFEAQTITGVAALV